MIVTASATAVVGAAASAGPLVDGPVIWFDADDADIAPPAGRSPNLLWDAANESVIGPFVRSTRPSRLLRHATSPFGTDPVLPAANVNALDEVPNSSWFTNRIGLFPMTAEEVARGPLEHPQGPDRSDRWTIVRAKTEGVTPGFNIRDGRGDVWVIKFDPLEYPNMASAAGVISNRIFHACGYNVPEDLVIHFRRDRLVLGEDVRISLPDGSTRPMVEADLERILSGVRSVDGRFRAIASRFLGGKPIGPFNYQGRRGDDPNDRIRHENRRELRGLRTIAGWVAHFDTKQHNSIDMVVEEDGRRFVRHYLIDFASTLGTGAHGPTYSWNYEHTIDLNPFLGRLFALGLHEDDWRRLRRPEGLDEVGVFVSDIFDPREWKPMIPNPAFANQTDRDAYWAAKIISAFTDEQLLAIVEQGRYEDAEATRYVARTLAERRDKIVRCWFDAVPPLDFFRIEDGKMIYRDLGSERGFYAGNARYRCRVAAVDADRTRGSDWSRWVEGDDTFAAIDLEEVRGVSSATHPFIAVECQVDRGSGWSRSVQAYVARRSGRVVAVDRD